MIDHPRARLRDYHAGSAMRLHAHDEASLSIVVRGGFTERVGRGERDYVRGHAAFFPAGVPHEQAFGSSGARQIIFQPRVDWIDYLTDSRVALADAPHFHSMIFHHLGDRLVEELGMEDSCSALACEGLMLEIVAAFTRSSKTAMSPRQPPTWLRVARDFMINNATRPLTLAEIATAAGRHEIHLAREFRRYFGTSVAADLRRLRVERAAGLLHGAKMGLSEIALECGFSSQSHLCRTFQAHRGVSPSAYRAQARGRFQERHVGENSRCKEGSSRC